MTSTPTAIDRAEVAAVIEPELAKWHVPGMSFGVLRDGAIEAFGFGETSILTHQPVDPDTLFQVGSISKLFTATLIVQLVEEGRLDLDRPVVTYLPELKLADATAQTQITLRHLLSHMAGFYGDRFDDFGPGDDSVTKAVATFDQLRQWTAPGELWSYCNTGFQLAGAVIEQLLGVTVEQAIRDRIFVPLKMEHSFFFAHEAITYLAAAGHNKLPEKEIEIARPYPLQRCMNAAGGIISTVSDLLRFARFHMDGTVEGEGHVLNGASREAMQAPQAESILADQWAIGFALRSVDGVSITGHGGSTNGFRAQLTMVPSKDVAVAMLTNGSGGTAVNRAVERWALERFAGVKLTDRPTITMTDDLLARYAGRYERPLADIIVSVKDGGLELVVTTKNPFNDKSTVMPPIQAAPTGERQFVVSGGESAGAALDFILGEGGAIRFMRFGGRVTDRIA